ncbi:MAG TPA: excinuclease ABC subunit UvrB [Candidatus Hydrogenedens sp.]|nr:excinuclease ABC subunit UvrB [Candidatus Hydrogenedens sp.]HOL18742.1 excinuclease ABC subunit UvrB [Candidatus Hydrogenedens sp.]HPP59108.1 excinuclease ABC subunit UvrB [Candidatus Hydrogenedens sp.]
MDTFELVSSYKPAGDQPEAIKLLVDGLNAGLRSQVLLGVTGSGKTFTIANVIATVNRPTLVLAPNKILAAQLYGEFKQLFPHNAVEYFVSYYDYYQPEAYIPTTDTYIEKDASINDEIDKMRHSATRAVLTRRDCIIVASVSCIYGIGSPEVYRQMRVELRPGEEFPREKLLASLVAMQYSRNDVDFYRGTFRVRGDVVDVFPAYETERAIRIEYFGDEIDALVEFDPLRGITYRKLRYAEIFPGSHYATTKDAMERAIAGIEHELNERLKELYAENQVLYAQRLEQRTRYDIEMLRELGYCPGIENYSRHLDGRMPGEPPYTLINYFPEDFLLVVDESHISIPQVRAMYHGDRSRKDQLIAYGFRLPSARDNRPLTFDEFMERINQVIYVSATPSEFEVNEADGVIVEQVVRPTGLVDPEVEVRTAQNQVQDLLDEIQKQVEKGYRVLVTTLTKRMAEELTEYYRKIGLRVRYMHSDVDTLERIELIRDLRRGEFDVLIGINLLREGLDIPEVSLVAILDADKEGYLRSETSLIQTCGRAARNLHGKVIMYADQITSSMEHAIREMERRRKKQISYNRKHKITPRTIQKPIPNIVPQAKVRTSQKKLKVAEATEEYTTMPEDIPREIEKLRQLMFESAERMDFEEAAVYRDRMLNLQRLQIELGL